MHQSGELLQLSPEGRLRLLDAVFLRFDELVAQTDVLKVETIASVYLVAANGVPRLRLMTSLNFSSYFDHKADHHHELFPHICLSAP